MPDQEIPVVRPVILAGGAGTRLWPLSTASAPKHLLPLLGPSTLFDETLKRVSGDPMFVAAIVVANIAQEAALSALLEPLAGARLLLEPVKRDSGPAIALAAAAADEGDLLLVCPSDQHVADPAAFRAAIAKGVPAARDGAIVTFGIEPDHPATGYGYIKAADGDGDCRAVDRFVEKPQLDAARAMIDAGGHYWNAGIFLASARTWRAALQKHAPAMLEAATKALGAARSRGVATLIDEEEFSRSPAQSIDYAVMEKADPVMVVPVSMGWSDVGSWQSVHDAADKDDAGNSVGDGHTVIDGRGNLVRSSGPRIALIGVEGLAVIATPDAVLVIPREDAQRVREAAAWFEEGQGQ